MTLDSARINWGKLAKRILLYFVVSLICIVILYPYFVMFLTALKSREEIFSPNGTIFPQVWHWNNFTEIFKRAPMAQYMLNSIIIASGSTAIAMICGIPAAYALARMKFKGQTAFLGFIIVSQMFAPVVLLIGIYKVMQTMAMMVEPPAMTMELIRYLAMGAFCQMSMKLDHSQTLGKMVPLGEKISSRLFSAVRNITK